jgi:hypothetical protein
MWLVPYLYQEPPAYPPDARPRFGTNLETCTRSCTLQNLGKNTHLLIIAAGFLGTFQPEGYPNYAPMLFRGEDASGWTRIPWPPDDWIVNADGTTNQAWNGGYQTDFIPQFENVVHTLGGSVASQDLHPGQLSFGVGCMCIQVVHDYVAMYLVTHDFGDSWKFVPAPTNASGAWPSVLPTMIKPKRDPSGDNDEGDPGRMLIALPDYRKRIVEFYFTDANFEKFTKTGGAIKPKYGLGQPDKPGANRTFVNYGGTKYKPNIFPAYPGEYEPKDIPPP